MNHYDKKAYQERLNQWQSAQQQITEKILIVTQI